MAEGWTCHSFVQNRDDWTARVYGQTVGFPNGHYKICLDQLQTTGLPLQTSRPLILYEVVVSEYSYCTKPVRRTPGEACHRHHDL